MATRDPDRERASTGTSDRADNSGGATARKAGARAKRASKPTKKRSTKQTLDAKIVAGLLAQSGKMTKAERLAAAAAVRGDWKDRPEWKGMSSVRIAAELRRRAFGRGGHA